MLRNYFLNMIHEQIWKRTPCKMTCKMQQKVGVNSGYANTCQSRHPEGFDKMFSELVACQIQ